MSTPEPIGDFTHTTLGQQVRFATGTSATAVAEAVAALSASRVMLIAGESEAAMADQVAADLPVVLRHREVVMHVPIEVAERARAAAVEAGADVLVSVGGGSTTGLAKAVALTSGLPIVAVPTTYAGSEATDVWGLTEAARKTTGSHPDVLPRVVVYDASFTVGLPESMTVASGLNAMAHCVDSLWAPRADPINAALAAEAARALHQGMPLVVAEPSGLPGREQMLYGAYLAAVSFASAGSGLHHKIAHVLGGTYNLPHAQTHATVLPYVLALNAPAAPAAERRLAAAFGSATALEGLNALRAAVGAPTALRDVGFRAEDVPAAAAAVLAAAPPGNPVPLDQRTLERLLHAAWEGTAL